MLTFGLQRPDREHKDRPAAFGIVERDGRIAAVRIERDGEPAFHDLPGGALDPGETEAQAMVREFGEETGLVVNAGDEVLRAAQLFLKSDGEAVRNLGPVFATTCTGEDAALKIEDDHTLVWLDPREAVVVLRHESHAWAVARWLRARRD